MLGRLIQEKDSIVVGKRGQPRPRAYAFLRFPAICNALRKTFPVWTKLLVHCM